ncbi:MAG: hypothetical protein IJM85_03795 [Clostridia bacterium]|nr:hypothetical protein [Clostridia bacterium]
MKKRTKILLICAAALVVVGAVIAAIFIIRAKKKAGVKPYQNSIAYFYCPTEGATRFAADSKLIDDKLGGTVDAFLSCDGTVGIARAGTGLFRVDGERILKIHPAGVERAALSLDNNIIVFTTATEVHIYDHRTGKVEDIKPEKITGVVSICISPSGNTVGYSVKSTDGHFYAYAHENGSSRLLASDAYIMAVSDGAEFCYFIRPENVELYYLSNRKEKKIGTGVSSLLEFNRDLTEVAFDMNGVTYYSVKGSAAKKLIDGASVYTTAAECTSRQGGDDCQSEVKDCPTLFNCVFFGYRRSSSSSDSRSVYDLWFVDSKKKVTELVAGAYQFSISEDGSKLSCLVDNDLYVMDSNDPGSRRRLCTNIYSFCAIDDASGFYCLSGDLRLYYVKADGVAKALDNNVVYCVLAPGGRCLYIGNYNKTGDLKIVDRDGDPAQVAEGVAHLEVMPAACYYYSDIYTDELGNKVYDVYSSPTGEHFELIVKAALMKTDSEEDE